MVGFLQTFEGVQKCKKSETLATIMERIVKAEVGYRFEVKTVNIMML